MPIETEKKGMHLDIEKVYMIPDLHSDTDITMICKFSKSSRNTWSLVLGQKKDIPNNWLKRHRVPMNRRKGEQG